MSWIKKVCGEDFISAIMLELILIGFGLCVGLILMGFAAMWLVHHIHLVLT